MKLLQLPQRELRRQLAGPGIWLRTGPFSLRVRSRLGVVADRLGELYGQFEVRNPRETFADFHIDVDSRTSLGRWLRPEAWFSFDGIAPFGPVPRDKAYNALERGIDWCVSENVHHYLAIRAAAVEKNGLAAILPGSLGSGKSTLAAALVLSGWRLLSDELTLVDRGTGRIHALPRPIALRDEAIALIRGFSPDAFLAPTSLTPGGAVAFMRPPKESVRRQHEPALPAWVIFPGGGDGSEPRLAPRSQDQTVDALVRAAINCHRLGGEGCRVCSALVRRTAGYDLQYGRLEDAVALLDRMAATADSATGED